MTDDKKRRPSKRKLEQVIPDGVMTLPFADAGDDDDPDAQCDNGTCWT